VFASSVCFCVRGFHRCDDDNYYDLLVIFGHQQRYDDHFYNFYHIFGQQLRYEEEFYYFPMNICYHHGLIKTTSRLFTHLSLDVTNFKVVGWKLLFSLCPNPN
jgi:hypothetical protein